MVKLWASRSAWGAALVSSIVLLSACAPGAPSTQRSVAPTAVAPAQKTAIKLGQLQSSLSTILVDVAVQRGVFARNGIEATVQGYKSGQGTAGIEELLRGSTEAYYGSVPEVTRVNSEAMEKDQPPPLVILLTASPGSTTLVTRSDLAYASVQDLKGMKVAASSLGSVHLVIFRRFLSDQKIPESSLNIQFVAVGAENMPQTLLTKQIDAFLHSDPTVAIAEQNGSGKVVMGRKELGDAASAPGTALIVRRDWLAKNQDTAKRLVQSFEQANQEFDQLPKADKVKLFSDTLKVEEPVMTLAADRVNPRVMPLREAADAFWRINQATMVERGEMSQKVKLEDIFDFSFAH
jgi:NitT/TauT family transport system substrate-binding protein